MTDHQKLLDEAKEGITLLLRRIPQGIVNGNYQHVTAYKKIVAKARRLLTASSPDLVTLTIIQRDLAAYS